MLCVLDRLQVISSNTTRTSALPSLFITLRVKDLMLMIICGSKARTPMSETSFCLNADGARLYAKIGMVLRLRMAMPVSLVVAYHTIALFPLICCISMLASFW